MFFLAGYPILLDTQHHRTTSSGRLYEYGHGSDFENKGEEFCRFVDISVSSLTGGKYLPLSPLLLPVPPLGSLRRVSIYSIGKIANELSPLRFLCPAY